MLLLLCKRVVQLLGSLLFIIVISDVLRQLRYARAQRRHGCCAPPRVKQSRLLLGLDFLRDFSGAVRQQRVLEHHRQLHNNTGGTMSMDTFGNTVINTSDPANMKAILSDAQTTFDLGPNRYKAFHPFLGDAIFTSDGEAWASARKLIKPNLSREQISSMLILLESQLQATLDIIHKAAGDSIDLQPLFLQLTMNTSSEFLFGHSTANAEFGQDFVQAFEVGQSGMAVRARFGPMRDILVRKDFWPACRTARQHVKNYVEKSLRQKSGRYTFLDALAQGASSPGAIVDHVLSLLVAGRDTTAGLLSITFFLLARHPDVWARLQSEVDQFQGERPDFDSIKQMTYLPNILKEVLRLYPATPLISRETNAPAVLPTGGGPDGKSSIYMNKNQRILLSLHAMHRRKDLYGDDAEEFCPDRWETLRPHWGYLPFSGGPRICIGQQFATTETSYIIVRIMQEFRSIRSMDSRPFKESVGLSLQSGNGTIVSLT